jgi:hypothetical protein
MEPPVFVTYHWTLYSYRASFTLSTLVFSPGPFNSLINLARNKRESVRRRRNINYTRAVVHRRHAEFVFSNAFTLARARAQCIKQTFPVDSPALRYRALKNQ